jgi:HPt (histidine-containing phosphotransfer) domain-containing protein
MRLFQNFSFWNSNLRFTGNSGHLTAFPRGCFKTNRVLEQPHISKNVEGFEMAGELVYVNTEEGIKRVMNNAKLYAKLLTKFKADTSLDDMLKSLGAGEYENAQIAAHTIKGVAANLSLTELYNQTLALETQIKARSVNPDQITQVESAFTETLKSIDEVIEQNG